MNYKLDKTLFFMCCVCVVKVSFELYYIKQMIMDQSCDLYVHSKRKTDDRDEWKKANNQTMN